MSKGNVLIIDYKIGNHQSVVNALRFLGYDFMVSGEKDDIEKAESYILPGVGAFGEAMGNLRRLGILEPLQKEVLANRKPILGICIGMQILAEDSEENGFHRGLGWIGGHVVKLKAKDEFRVPHVGWTAVKAAIREPLFTQTSEGANFYFDHSYHFIGDSSYVFATCWHGENVVAAIQRDNIFGVQFHPEKSQNNGLKLFRSFFNYVQKNYRISYAK